MTPLIRLLERAAAPRGVPAGVLLLAAAAWGCGPGAGPPAHGSDASESGPARTAELPHPLGFGRPATPGEIAAWNIDVRPDGEGLPPGQGTVAEGEAVYRRLCAACHGATGTEGPNDRLVGRDPADPALFARSTGYRDRQTIGSYWPYATTVYDYVNRAMPQNAPGSLTPNEVYAVTAYLLHLNGLIPSDAVMDAATLPRVVMPARDRFVPDDRTGGPVVR